MFYAKPGHKVYMFKINKIPTNNNCPNVIDKIYENIWKHVNLHIGTGLTIIHREEVKITSR